MRRVDGRSRPANPKLRGLSRLLENADGRDALPRRYRDIVAELVHDLGGSPTEAQTIILRRAATLAVWCEQKEAQLAAGGDLDIGPFTTAANSLRRLLCDLGLERRLRDITPSVGRYLEGKA
jgi:hypothetical protein